MSKKILLSIAFYFLLTQSSSAATLVWQPAVVRAAPGELVEVSLWLKPEGEPVNALEGELVYPAGDLILQEVSNGNSIINLWLESPAMVSPGSLRFSGIIPGGWSGVLSPYDSNPGSGKILTLFFSAQSAGQYSLAWRRAQVLRHDGLATPVPLRTADLVLEIAPALPNNAAPVVLTDDQVAPGTFVPVIARDRELFANRWFVSFATSDTDSGIAGYEIQEHADATPKPGAWRPATSPYVLTDQQLRKYVSVRALDRAGNERVSTLAPTNLGMEYNSKWLWFILSVTCLVILSYYFYSVRRRS